MEYAVQTGVSLSTLRRYIKAGKIEYRVEKGRYLIGHSEPMAKPVAEPSATTTTATATSAAAGDRVSKLENDLKKAREEIVELKTLIALYEEGISHPPQQSL